MRGGALGWACTRAIAVAAVHLCCPQVVRKTAKSPAPGGVQERVFARTLSLKLQEPEYSNHIDTVERYIRKCEVQTYAHSALHVTLYGSVSSGGIVLYACSIQTVKSQWNHPYLEKGAK